MKSQYMADRYLYMDSLADTLDKKGINCNVRVAWHRELHEPIEEVVEWKSPIYKGIIDAVGTFSPDIVIKTTRSHKNAHSFFTPMDWYLLKACPASILLVRPTKWTEDTVVVAALDPDHKPSLESELDTNILRTEFNISSQLSCPLHAVHCFAPAYWDVLFETLGKTNILDEILSLSQREDNLAAIEKMRNQQYKRFPDTCNKLAPNCGNQHMLSGGIDEVLPNALTKMNAGILVLGTTYRKGFMGSTAQTLVEAVECDVLAVNPRILKPHFTRHLPV